ELWAELGDPDAARAFRAEAELAASPRGATALLAGRLKPVAAPRAGQGRRWVAGLDAGGFDVRGQAARELARLRRPGRPALEEVLANRPPLELRRRAEELLGRLDSGREPPAEELRRRRAVEVLERVGTPQARELLEKLARGAPGALLTRDAEGALRRL